MIVPDSMGKMRVAGKKGMGHSAKSGKQKAEAVDQIPMGVKLYCWGISDHQRSWGYEDGPWKGPGPPLLVAADLIHKPPASIRFAPIKHALAVTVEPFKFSPA